MEVYRFGAPVLCGFGVGCLVYQTSRWAAVPAAVVTGLALFALQRFAEEKYQRAIEWIGKAEEAMGKVSGLESENTKLKGRVQELEAAQVAGGKVASLESENASLRSRVQELERARLAIVPKTKGKGKYRKIDGQFMTNAQAVVYLWKQLQNLSTDLPRKRARGNG